MTTSEKIRDLIAAGEKLLAAVLTENKALRARNRDQLQAGLTEKIRLSNSYHKLFKMVTEDSDVLEQIRQQYGDQVRDLNERLRKALEENGWRLEAELKASNIMVDLIAESVRKAQPVDGTYVSSGSFRQHNRNSKKTVAFALDQTL